MDAHTQTTTYSATGPLDKQEVGKQRVSNPAARREKRAFSSQETAPASFVASGAFPFIGTAGDHLEAIERRIRLARASHQPVAGLLKRQRILKARCAALGACHE